MCKFVMSCDLLLNIWPMNYQKPLINVMSGVTKLIDILDENTHKIAILKIVHRNDTYLLERPPKAEVRGRNIRDTTVSENVRFSVKRYR